MRTRGLWLDAAIIALALALRLAALDLKPVHFDEGVNGWFVDQMTTKGFYHYDPGFFHGPLHFYVLFAALRLLGREAWALRLPVALVSTLCVAMVLAFRSFLSARASRFAALAMAISPGCVFYGRYAIHESWLVLFLLLTAWGLAGLWHKGKRVHLWAAGMGLTGMILTKETYAIHSVAFALALPALLAWERVSPSAPAPFGGRHWTNFDFDRVAIVATCLIFFFYTGGLLDWSSLPGLWQTFARWGHIGLAGESGHEKSWHYFLELITRYEWPALVGLLASVGLVWRGTNRLARYLAIYGCGALTAYSLIAYKTPWCVISLLWPFHLIFGHTVDRLIRALDAWTARTVAGVVCAYSLGASCLLNFRDFTSEDEPYVYVQTLPAIDKLLGPLRRLAARDVRNFHLPGLVLMSEHHPLLWLLGDFSAVNFLPEDGSPATYDAAFLLVDEPEAERVEGQLTRPYFREILRLRGDSTAVAVLYFDAARFAAIFPGRAPEFAPALQPPLDAP